MLRFIVFRYGITLAADPYDSFDAIPFHKLEMFFCDNLHEERHVGIADTNPRPRTHSKEMGMYRRQFLNATLTGIIALTGTLTFGCAPGQSSDSATSSTSSEPGSVSGTASPYASDPSGSPSSVKEDEAKAPDSQANPDAVSSSSITIQANDTSLQMTLANTGAASALVELLRNGPVSIPLHAYGGFEKVGPLPQALPASDEQITTAPGDVMLYQGNQMTVFYGSNTWSYTPLGHIENATAESLLAAFGEGDVTVQLSL